MTVTDIAVVIAACGAFITSATAAAVSVYGVLISQRNSVKIDKVHKSTNGKMEELVKEVREASFAKGEKSEAAKHL